MCGSAGLVGRVRTPSPLTRGSYSWQHWKPEHILSWERSSRLWPSPGPQDQSSGWGFGFPQPAVGQGGGGRLGDPGNTRAGQSVWDSTTIPGGGSQVLRGPHRSPRTVNSPSVRRDSRMVEQRKTQVIRLAWAPSPGVSGAHVTSNQLFSFLCLSCLLFQTRIRKAGLTTLLCNTVRSHM